METLLTEALTPGDAEAFDAFVLSATWGHFSQSSRFLPLSIAGRPVRPLFFLARRGGVVVGAAIVLQSKAGPVPLPVGWTERGPVCEIDDLPDVVEALRKAALKRGIARLGVMPYVAGESVERASGHLRACGFRDVQKFDGAHVSTLRLDVGGKTDDQLFVGGERKGLRQRIVQAEKAGATVRSGGARDVERLKRLHEAMMAAQEKSSKSNAWFGALETWLGREGSESAHGRLFLCEHDSETLAAAWVVKHGPIATFVVGASSGAPRKFTKTVLPLVAAAKWCRDNGGTTFDLGGVPAEEDTDPKRTQIAHFKFEFEKKRVPLVHEHQRMM